MIACQFFERHQTNCWISKIERKLFRPVVYCPNGKNPATESTLQFARNCRLPVVVNAGLYDSKAFGNTNKPEGIVICMGEIVQNKPVQTHPGSMPLLIDANGDVSYTDADADAEQLVKRGIQYAVCGFMPIIIHGKKPCEEKWPRVGHFSRVHARQVIGQYQNGDYCLITTEGCPNMDNSRGLTIAELQEVCLEHGLWYAYNLDGGTSTATVIEGNQVNPRYRTIEGRVVPTYIAFVPR